MNPNPCRRCGRTRARLLPFGLCIYGTHRPPHSPPAPASCYFAFGSWLRAYRRDGRMHLPEHPGSYPVGVVDGLVDLWLEAGAP